MAKEIPWFKFEISEWMFGRIQKQPEDVQGMFINLCCKYWHKLGEYTVEDAELDFGPRIQTLITAKILHDHEGKLCIKFLDQQLGERAQDSEKQRQKGLKSAELRATRVQQRLTDVQPSSTEEKRREEKREENIKTLGSDKNQPVVKIKSKYLHEPSYLIYGEQGYKQLMEEEQLQVPKQEVLFLKKFMVEKNGAIFDSKSYLINSFKNFINQQFK